MRQWKVISDEDVEAIHHATLRVLSETGIVLSHPEIKAQLYESGASIKDDRVLLSHELVEKVLQDCGKEVHTMGRSGEKIVIGDGSLH